jgi:hypothetical protein
VPVAVAATAGAACATAEPRSRSGTATGAGAAEAADDTSVPAAWRADPLTAASPDVTGGTIDPLVTACVTVRNAFPVTATTVLTADPGSCPA